MRNTSSVLREASYAQESGEILVTVARLSHPDWDSPVLVVNDRLDLSHGGETYLPFPFQVKLPDDEDEGIPVLGFTLDNVSQDLIAGFRRVTGDINARVSWVLRSSPEVIEVGPFEAKLTGIEYNAATISGVLTIEPILEESFGYLTMTPGNTPGIF